MLILSPIPKQFLDESGVPYTDGTVSIYLHGDTEFAEVYADAEGTALIENPCILDSHGMWQGFVDPDKPMDYIVKDSEGNVITRFCNISLPTGDDIPGVKVISSDGSINVDETLENGERTFDITVNDDMFKPSCAKFSHEAVNGGGQVSFDSFELEGDPDRDIYLTDGVITFAEGVYHISANLVIGNDECHNEYFGITVNFGDCSTAKVWDRSFVHEESVEIGLDIVADVDGYTVVPTIAELPDDMHCSISRLYIHKVSGAGVGGSMASVEHDGTLVGDGTHNDPLGVKDWSEIRTTLENTTNELLDHEVSPSAHQDIRDELERKEDKDNKVTSWGSTLSDEKYPSEKLVKDTIDNLPPGTAVKGNEEPEYRTGNVNLTPADIGSYSKTESDERFKAVQTPVTDPSASGAGLEFIDSVTQNANGEITPHKKSVQDGTTAQKGVVQLQDSIGSTESSADKAVTPHAVREAINAAVSSAYHAAGTKSVAQLTSSLLVAGNEGCVYNVTDSGTTTSDFVDGAGHPINAGDNVGVCDVGGGVYKFDLLSGFVDLTNYLTKTGDASNATSTLTKASGDTSTMTSGGKLSAIFTAISSFFASVASALNGKADKANITGATKCKITYNGQGIVTSGANLDASDIPNLSASKITSGTFGTDRIADDAITANKVKDNETLPVNVSGNAATATKSSKSVFYTTGNLANYTRYLKIGNIETSAGGQRDCTFLVTTPDGIGDNIPTTYIVTASNRLAGHRVRYTRITPEKNSDHNLASFGYVLKSNNSIDILMYRPAYSGAINITMIREGDLVADFNDNADGTGYVAGVRYETVMVTQQVGSTTTPVYVDSNGQVQPCNVLSGSTSNFNKRFTWTYTVNQNDQYITTAVINDNTNYIAEYVEWHNANVGKLTHPPLIILSVSARTNVANAGLISLCMYRNGEGCDVIGEDYTYMGNVHGSSARNTQYFTDRPFYNGEPYYLCIRNETSNPMWTAGTILDIGIRIVAHAVSVT